MAGARVLIVVNDGAQTNKSVWKRCDLGIEEKNGKETIKNYILHPIVDDFKVFFMLDPPHGWKTIRNQMFNNDDVFAMLPKKDPDDHTLRIIRPHKVVEDLFISDTVFGEGRLCPRLTRAHVWPTSFQKMSVRFAMQVR